MVKKYGSKSLVYIDESGFEEMETKIYAWSKRGKKIYGEKQGKRGKRENLVAARRKKEKDLIAPMLFTGSLDARGFELTGLSPREDIEARKQIRLGGQMLYDQGDMSDLHGMHDSLFWLFIPDAFEGTVEFLWDGIGDWKA